MVPRCLCGPGGGSPRKHPRDKRSITAPSHVSSSLCTLRMPSRSRSPSRSPWARTRRPPPSLNSSIFEYDEDGQPAAGPSRSGLPRTPTTATFPAPGSAMDGSWLSTPVSRPVLRRHISAGAPPSSPSAGLGQSLPGSIYVPSSRSRVQPQNDYLANWETLADLMIPTPQEAQSSMRKRDGSSPAAALRSSQPSRSTLRQSPVLSVPNLADAAVSEPSMSGILSSSPPNMDSVMESLATAVGDAQEPQAQAATRSPISIRYGATDQHIRLPSGPPQLPPTTPSKREYKQSVLSS